MVLEIGKSQIRVSAWLGSDEIPFLAYRKPPSCPHIVNRGEDRAVFSEGHKSQQEAPTLTASSEPSYLPKAGRQRRNLRGAGMDTTFCL